ncbi:MAG: sulfurtransferase complex subunit TusC [Methylococcales bacterium]|nr:sulfurtransferase complex subunit TusC [Methylococcales bacterium]
MKNYLFIMRQPPHASGRVQETLDMILTAAAFDQQVGVLFCDDGVLQLASGQNPAAIGLKDTARIFTALEIYDVDALYAEAESLAARGLTAADLILPVRLVSRADVNQLMNRHQLLIPD